MIDTETGGRHPQSKRREFEPRVTRDAGGSPILRRPRQSNVQFAAKMPIVVTVIGICPIRENFVAGCRIGRDGEGSTGSTSCRPLDTVGGLRSAAGVQNIPYVARMQVRGAKTGGPLRRGAGITLALQRASRQRRVAIDIWRALRRPGGC